MITQTDKNQLVSVIMAVYNAEDTLSEAVESILKQTYKNLEFVICDDASTDNSYAILKEYVQKDSRIILLQNEKNSKLSFSLNHCLQHCSGKYIARMDADDISLPERLETEIQFLQEHPEYDLVGSAMQRFNDDGMADTVCKSEWVDKYSLLNGVPFNHATIVTYKSVYDKLGGYTVAKRTQRAQDLDLWFRFFANGFNGHNLLAPLYLVREDINAIKRRKFSVRWNAMKTRRIGYKMLGFPWHWWLRFCIREFLKALVPYKIIAIYRKYQKNKYSGKE